MVGLEFKKGATRYAIIYYNKYAIKIPYLGRWKNFLLGVLANIQEKEFTTLKNDNLCPVIFSSWGSFINMMSHCHPITIEEFNSVLSNDDFVNLPVEKKITSFGKLNKK